MEKHVRVNPSTHIFQLSDDCLHVIFKMIDRRTDRDAFGLTCSRWLRIQNSCHTALHFKRSFTHREGPNPRSPNQICTCHSHLRSLLNRYQNLNFLSLSGCNRLPESCISITDRGLLAIAEGCRFLTSLNLYRCNITDVGLVALSESCSGIKHLNLSCCFRISDSGIRALTEKCRKLRSIDVSHCSNINGTGFDGCSEALACVVARPCKLEPEGILAILSGGGLEYMDISKLTWSINGRGFTDIDTRFISKLTVLNFQGCRNVRDEAVVRIARGCPLLGEWNLSACGDVTVVGWEAIGLFCCALEKLHVMHCRNLCDRGLRAVRDGCKQLKVLYFDGSDRVSSTEVDAFKLWRGEVHIFDEQVMPTMPADWPF